MKSSSAILLPLLLVFSCSVCIANAQDAKKTELDATEKLVFKTKWGGERITLPPQFAPDMKLKGIEEIRFAPGMFQADSESFFSYVFLFEVSADQKLTHELLQKETLVYYQGLSSSLMKSKGKEVDTSKFTFKLEKSKDVLAPPASVKAGSVTQFVGKLDWVEPFATLKNQILHFELQSWTDTRTGKNYLFVCVSPKPIDDKKPIWKELREIRKGFEVVVVSKEESSDAGK